MAFGFAAESAVAVVVHVGDPTFFPVGGAPDFSLAITSHAGVFRRVVVWHFFTADEADAFFGTPFAETVEVTVFAEVARGWALLSPDEASGAEILVFGHGFPVGVVNRWGWWRWKRVRARRGRFGLGGGPLKFGFLIGVLKVLGGFIQVRSRVAVSASGSSGGVSGGAQFLFLFSGLGVALRALLEVFLRGSRGNVELRVVAWVVVFGLLFARSSPIQSSDFGGHLTATSGGCFFGVDAGFVLVLGGELVVGHGWDAGGGARAGDLTFARV